MALQKASNLARGSFFKPGDHVTDLALLVEPTSITRGLPALFNGVQQTNPDGSPRVKDSVTADITVFGTTDSLNTGTPTAVLRNVTIEQAMLTSSLEKLLDDKGALVGVVRKIPTKGGQGWAFRDADAASEKLVSDYYDTRDAKLAEAVASAPGFD